MSKNINLNQLSLPFSQGRSRAISYDDRVRAFWFLTGACFLSLVVYVYAVNATARNVALRASLEKESTELGAELATLEFQYIDLKGEVTIERAGEYGFQEVKEPLYVSRESSEASLSFNTQNR